MARIKYLPKISICTAAVFLFLFLILPSKIYSQNPDLTLTQAEIDSILVEYDNVFPIWGREVIKSGFDLPYPIGVSLNSIWMKQDMILSNMQLGVNDGEMKNTDFIQFDNTISKVFTVNGRLDLWVLPFINLWGIVGKANTSTEVKIKEPLEFTSKVDFKGFYYGFGITGAISINKIWLAMDMNWTWIDLDKLDQPARARVIGIRAGKTIKLGEISKLSVWVGAMNQKLLNTTTGSVTLEEAVPQEVWDDLADYQNSEWYQSQPPLIQNQIDDLVEQIQEAGLRDTKITYSLDKQPAYPWNMVAGLQYELNKHWVFRTEVGFIHRASVLLNVNYRFDL